MTEPSPKRIVSVTEPVYQRLTLIKTEQAAERGRLVSYSEVLENLLDVWAEVTA